MVSPRRVCRLARAASPAALYAIALVAWTRSSASGTCTPAQAANAFATWSIASATSPKAKATRACASQAKACHIRSLVCAASSHKCFALEGVVRILAENRWPWRMHATYDETITRALDVFEKVIATRPCKA
jgi:hypothetical protein